MGIVNRKVSFAANISVVSKRFFFYRDSLFFIPFFRDFFCVK